jgi:hypothetical protein
MYAVFSKQVALRSFMSTEMKHETTKIVTMCIKIDE